MKNSKIIIKGDILSEDIFNILRKELSNLSNQAIKILGVTINIQMLDETSIESHDTEITYTLHKN